MPNWLQFDDDDEGKDFEGFELEEVLKEAKAMGKEDNGQFYGVMGDSESDESDFEGFELNQM